MIRLIEKEENISDFTSEISLFSLEYKTFGAFNPHLIALLQIKEVLDEAEILSLIVLKEYRRQGVAKSLMHHFFQNLKFKNVFLEVNENNSAAIAFYKNLGFEIIGLRKEYYGKENALTMLFQSR